MSLNPAPAAKFGVCAEKNLCQVYPAETRNGGKCFVSSLTGVGFSVRRVPSAEVVSNIIPELSDERTRAAARFKVLSGISKGFLLTEPRSRAPFLPMSPIENDFFRA